MLFALVGLRHCCGLSGAPGLRSRCLLGLRRLLSKYVQSRQYGMCNASFSGLLGAERIFEAVPGSSGNLHTRLAMGDVRAPRDPEGMGLASMGGFTRAHAGLGKLRSAHSATPKRLHTFCCHLLSSYLLSWPCKYIDRADDLPLSSAPMHVPKCSSSKVLPHPLRSTYPSPSENSVPRYCHVALHPTTKHLKINILEDTAKASSHL